MPKKFNIGFVTPRLDLVGGGEILIIELLKRLRNNYDITLYTPDINLKTINFLSKLNIKLELIKINHEKHSRYSYEIDQYNSQINHHDLYFCNHIELTQLKVYPKICYVHEPLRLNTDNYDEEPFWSDEIYSPEELLKEFNSSYFCANRYFSGVLPNFLPNTVLTNSRKTKRDLEKNTILKNIKVVYPGYKAKKKNNKTKRKKNFKVLFLGVLGFHKNVQLFISLAKKCKDIDFTVVGKGPEYPGKIENPFVGKIRNLIFKGTVSDKELDKIFNETNCLVNLSLREPFGMNMLEAANYGIPIITTKNSGVKEVLKSALIETEFNLKKIKLLLYKLKDNKKYYLQKQNELIKNSSKFTWDNFTKKIDFEIKKTLSSKKNTKKKNNINLLYHIDKIYNKDEFDERKWNGHMPLIGRYYSEAANTIKEHFKQFKKLKINKISFHLDLSSNFSEIGRFILVIERISRIALYQNLDFKFNFCFMYADVSQKITIRKVISLIKKLNYKNFYINGKKEIIIYSDNFSQVSNLFEKKYFRLMDHKKLQQIYKLNEIKKYKNLNKDTLFDAFNNFREDRFIEEVI